MYSDPDNLAYLQFLHPILEEVQSVNKSFESSSADISKLLKNLTNLVKSISKRFVNPNCRQNPLTTNMDSYTIQNVYFGYEFDQILNTSKSNDEKKRQLKERCLRFL